MSIAISSPPSTRIHTKHERPCISNVVISASATSSVIAESTITRKNPPESKIPYRFIAFLLNLPGDGVPLRSGVSDRTFFRGLAGEAVFSEGWLGGTLIQEELDV